jgi:glutamate synthase (NADPH/NADH) small chain
MAKPTGFLEYEKKDRGYEKPAARKKTYREFVKRMSPAEVREQATRCMDCGIPFCHNGCPVNNQIPDWNNLVYKDQWKAACDNLHSTNNFPEFTGRICPAPCEASCTLNIQDVPVAIKTIECAIVDKGWQEGWITPQVNPDRTGRKVAVVGSGPAGMAAAQQLARAGHEVHLYEKAQQIGGLMRYGIPNFKLDKKVIDRRVQQMVAEGVVLHTGVHVGKDISVDQLADQYDAIAMAGGAEKPRDLPIPGRELDGIHFAMEFLGQQNRRVTGEPLDNVRPILAGGKHVIVVGGGDTGSDCIGTSNRQGALSVTQIEIMPMPPEKENKHLTWPDWPWKLRTSSSHEEGAERDFAVTTTKFTGKGGNVKKLHCARVDGAMKPVPGTEFELKADLVLLAMGFVSPLQSMLDEFGIQKDARGNAKASTDGKGAYATSAAKVFAAGDLRRGQSLVVWAIREGRQCARAVDEFFMGFSELPR